jgi:hypothetical protein
MAPLRRRGPGLSPRRGRVAPRPLVHLPAGDEPVRVVGVSYRQAEIRRAVGVSRGPVAEHVLADLVAEPENEHDPNAVAVCVSGHHVGYLSRDDAARYQAAIAACASGGRRVLCAARAYGGGPDAETIGMRLELGSPEAVRRACGGGA